MRQSSLLLSLLFLWTAGVKGQSLIPSPLTYQPLTGSHPLERTYRIEPESKAIWREAKAAGWDVLQSSSLSAYRGHSASRNRNQGIISMACYADDPRPEAYALRITPDTLWVKANTTDGWRHALTTLRRLAADANNGAIPCVSIEDAPAMAWRGVMLDVSRHFYPIPTLYNVVDWLARYKMNRLHLHLTDAAGWRMEIKRYPLLTKQAAWRDAALWKTWWNGTRAYAHEGDTAAYGGYYTQKQLRQLVKYASRRGVTIVPEIEMPAHSEEVTAAYPELSCTHDPKGQPDFCPGNEGTFTFLQNVLAEVMDVFPSTDIHVGGDEAGKAAWPTCSLCRQRVKDEDLPSVQALQGYLIRRIAAYARERGRRIIAWDEVLDDSMPTDVQVMIWRDTTTVRKAIARGHDVILAPGAFCYLDAYQDDPSLGPEANGAYRPLSRVYGYRPLAGLSVEERRHIRGIHGCLWTEYVPTPADVERMLLPRLLAIAENGWTGGFEKDYASFRQRAVAECNRLRAQGIQAFDLGAEVGDRPASRQPVWHKARGAKVIYHRPYNNTYTAGGETALTDGRRGGWDYGAGSAWQGFISRGRIDLTLDLGKVMDVRRVALDFFQSAGPEIYLASSFRIAAVDEAGQETELVTRSETTVRHTLPSVETWDWQGEIRTRYLHIQANSGPLGGWLFTDEIIVE